jgi:large subunit ribosomal protein L15
MQFHDILVRTSKRKKRVGRGGKRGTTSGKGTKGQLSRAGRKIRPEIRDRIQKIPKRRGATSYAAAVKPLTVDLALVERDFKAGEKVTPRTLERRGLITLSGKKREVKILGQGALSKKLIFENVFASRPAAEKILSAGGEIRKIPTL